MIRQAFLIVALVRILICASALGEERQQSAGISRAQNAARRQWRGRGRTSPRSNSADLRGRALAQKQLMRAAGLTTGIVSGSGWQLLGPSSLPSDASGIGLQDYNWVSGRVTAVAIDPNDGSGNTVFVGGAYGGVWKSIKAGTLSPNPSAVVWTPLTDDQPTLAIGALAVQPQITNPDPTRSVVLAGTGETNSSADSYYGLGMLRSSDGGKNWTLISQDASGSHSFAGMGFSQIVFSNAIPSLVVAGAGSASEGIIEGLENPIAVNRGIYYSSDAGGSWRLANVTDPGGTVTGASVTSVAYNAAAKMFYAAIRFHGFYSSTDGASWTRLQVQPGGLTVTACPPQTAQMSACPLYRGLIAVVPNRAGPSNAGEIYAWYVDENDINQHIWKSLDGGLSWTRLDDSGITNCGDLLGGCGTENASDNFTLVAVPNSLANATSGPTDVYAGAANIFKCTITNAFPTCNGTGKNTFMNLTHVDGCSDIARVHPGQHAMDSLVSNGAAVLYFGNDGGTYRALDGFMGLTTGACGLTNQFDSLNATLGPLTQFVSLGQSASDPNLLFGGTHDNGAPATAFSQSGNNWVNVNAGDVGSTAINSANDSDWFIATPPNSVSGVNILSCTNGINCHTQDFASVQVVDSSSVGGDSAPFDLSFLFDPANSGTLLVGTCKVWRGATTGGNFSLLSPDFENGGTGVCSGNETNTVRTIAAGGPADSNGYSQVIYAGTDGDGPLISAPSQGGKVWVTMNSDGGPPAWADRTGAINSRGFPVSAVAIDVADRSGQTAYVAVMGFHTPHLWKTTNAGISWTDFSGNLPDAPVDSMVMDSGASTNSGTIYIGTDIGVFASNTASASWSEVGPPAGPGFLPSVAVTALKIFNSGGLKLLRAATYGRGIWQWDLVTTPDFQLSIANNPQTIFAPQTATYTGTIYARNGYANSVNLSCVSATTAPPQNCAISPPAIVPTTQGSAFTISATGAAGDYSFNLQGAGTDPSRVTHAFPVSLHVVDFNLSAPSPTSVNVAPGATSAPVSMIVSAAGVFNGPVTLSCSGLPAGTTCQFQPLIVSPTSASPAPVSLTISTSITSPPGTYQIMVNAATPGAKSKSQLLIVSVNFVPDYILAIANPSLTSHVNLAATFNGTLTSVNGYSSAVALTCGTGAPASCVVSPSSIVPSDVDTVFAITVSSVLSQAFAFNVNAVGSDVLSVSHSAPVAFTALPSQSFDFTLSATPPSVSIASGQTATYSLDVSPTGGTFPGNVTFSCSGAPILTTCNFNPPQISSGSGDSVITVTALTTAPTPAVRTTSGLMVWFPVAALLWTWKRQPKIKRRTCGLLMMILVAAVCGSSCGSGLQGNGTLGSGSPGTPAGTYNLQITVSAASVTHSAQVKLVITQ